MTPLADNLTAGAVLVCLLLAAVVKFVRVVNSTNRAQKRGRAVMLAAIMVLAVIYSLGVLDIREPSELLGMVRLSIAGYFLNYALVYRYEVYEWLAIIRHRIKAWNLRR